MGTAVAKHPANLIARRPVGWAVGVDMNIVFVVSPAMTGSTSEEAAARATVRVLDSMMTV